MTRTEAIVISAAVALAMFPRVESKVQAYVGTHRTEIQIALNELQGKRPIPFAAPEAAPQAPVTEMQLAMDEVPPLPPVPAVRLQMARVRPVLMAARKAQLRAMKIEGLQDLPNVNIMIARQNASFAVFQAKLKHCPQAPIVRVAPAVPAVPTVDTVSIVSSSY